MIVIWPRCRSGAGRRGLPLVVVRGNISRLGEQRGIFLAEHLGAEPNRRVDLRLAERAFSAIRAAQGIEERTRPGVEELLQLAERALRHLVDGKFAGIVSASGNESDQGLGLRYLVGIKATSRAQAWRSTPAPPASSPGGTLAAYPRHLQSGRPFRTTRTIIQRS